MAEIFDFYVADNRTIKFNVIEPILQEDNGVAVWRFRIPKVLNNIDMSGFAWWFVYINAAKQKYSEPLTLTADADDPDNYCIADYTIDYGISLTPGSFTFALEAINANGSGDIVEEWHTKTYSHSVIGTLQGNQAEYSETESDIISALMVQIQEKYNALVGGATPIPVASISAMTDTSKIYLLTTDNNWYCYNGSTWVSGGQYASGIVIDPTLTQSGQAADAKVVGDAFNDITTEVYASAVQSLTLSVGLINKYGQETDVSAYEHGSLDVSEGDVLDVESFYYGGNFPAYVLMSGNTVSSFVNGTSDRSQYLSRVTIPQGVDKIVINGRVADYRAKAVLIDENHRVLKIQSGSSVIVGTDPDRYSYTNINDAVLQSAGKIIEVDYGEYDTEVQNLATDKTIIGKNKNLCILYGNNRNYDTPPIEIAAGLIDGFTIRMENSASAEHKGYAIHSDNAATVDKTLTIRNCNIFCSGAHTIGFGVKIGETVVFENCNIYQLDETEDNNAVYIHNGAGSNVSDIHFRNCYFKSYGKALKLQAWRSGNPCTFEFINCTVDSTLYGHSDQSIWTDYVSGSTHDENRLYEFSGNFTLLATSHGNNVSVLNA